MNQQHDFKGLDRSLRKQRIIDTAIKIFHEKGYRSATLDDVAKELGLSKAALYHYVSSKEALLSIIYIQALESFFAHAYRIGEQDLEPPEKLRVLIHNHIKHIIIENLAMFAVFFSEENQLPEKDFQKAQEEKRKYTRVVEGIIQEGISKRYFRTTDAKLQAHAIIGMCNWLYKWYKPGERSRTPDEIAENFISFLEHGYLARNEAGEVKSVPAVSKPAGKAETLRRLKRQAAEMARLIEDLERVV
jgi:TetR/AcrR family transcriptional regulator, cholesterol catabolism regulator